MARVSRRRVVLGHGDARALLPAVLQGVQAEVGHRGGLLVPEDAEHAARVAESVRHGLPSIMPRKTPNGATARSPRPAPRPTEARRPALRRRPRCAGAGPRCVRARAPAPRRRARGPAPCPASRSATEAMICVAASPKSAVACATGSPPAGCGKRDLRADAAAREAALGQRHGQPAPPRSRAPSPAGRRRRGPQPGAGAPSPPRDRSRAGIPAGPAVNALEGTRCRPASRPARCAEQHDHRPRAPEDAAQHAVGVVEDPDHADDRRREDRAALGLVVETDVAARDRHLQGPAGVAQPLHRPRELPHDLRPLRVAEVEAVRRRHGPCPRAGDVARRLRRRQHGSAVRVQVAVPPVAVEGEGERPAGALDADHPRPSAGGQQRVRPHHVVVLARDPALARHRRRRQQGRQRFPRGRGGPRPERLRVERLPRREVLRLADRPVVERAPRRQAAGWESPPPSPRGWRTRSRPSAVTAPIRTASRVPLGEDALHLRLAAPADDEQHPAPATPTA